MARATERLAGPPRLGFKRRRAARFLRDDLRRGSPALNYRHAFHAGNFADVFKHAVLLRWLGALTADPEPLELLDTHAGAGIYDLSDASAGRTGEAAEGIGRFLPPADPEPAVAPLTDAVRALNRGGAGPLYPGSPLLACGALRPGDRYVGCELRAEDADALERALRARVTAVRTRVVRADGWLAARQAAPGRRRALLIDPPFEDGNDAAQVAEALSSALARGEPAAVWAPLKDLDGFDRLLGRIEALRPLPSTAVQLRLRPPKAPLRLNGCAMILVGGPDLGAEAEAVARAVAARCGEAGGGASLERFGAQP